MTQPLPAKKAAAAMILAALSAACLLAGYEFIRAAAASLFIESMGTSRMPYAMSAVPLAAAFFIYLYGIALSRAGAFKTLAGSICVCAGVFVAAYTASSCAETVSFMRASATAFYIFAEVYIVVLVEQYWSFINSTLRGDQARVFNGPITGVGALGPLAADWIISHYAERVGTENLILWAAGAMIPAAFLMWQAYRLAGEPAPASDEAGGKKGPLHLSLIKTSRPLMTLLFIVALSQALSTALNLKLYETVEAAISDKNLRTAYFGAFWLKVNGSAMILQFIAAPLLLKRLSLRTLMVLIPCLHVLNAAAVFAAPTLGVVSFAFIAFKSLDYSVFRAAKELIYIPLSFDARYRAKQVIDSFTYRFSKGATALGLSGWKAVVGAVPGQTYSLIALASAAVWTLLAFPLTSQPEEK